jgi:hypothetical protein
MTETTMSVALAKAGRKSPKGRLQDLAVEAWDYALSGLEADDLPDEAHGREKLKELATMAINISPRDHRAALEIFLGELMKDGEAMNALMNENGQVRQKASEYLNRVAQEQIKSKDVRVKGHERTKPDAKSGGHTPGETQVPDAARGGGDQSRVEAQVMAVPAAPSPERIAAERRVWERHAATWFDRQILGGRKFGDLTYPEMKRAALVCRDSGLEHLHQAYVMVRTLKSVGYHPGMETAAARDWADTDVIRAADQRFTEFGHLLTGEIDAFLEQGDA